MSVALFVKLKCPMLLYEIEAASTAALRELLNLDYDPLVSTKFDDADRVGRPSEGLLTDSSYRVVCSLLGHEEKVTIMPFTVPEQVTSHDDSYSFVDQNYVSVDWYSNKGVLCWALSAAVLVGVAKKQESPIQDNAGFFTKAESQTPDDFCATLRLSTPQADIERAAVALYEKMPKSAEITEWLMKRGQSPA